MARARPLDKAIVVLWRGIGWEWYYPALVDGTNCVIADETDIVAKLDALEADPELQARLRAAAWPFHEAHISGEAVLTRWAHALVPLAARQRGSKLALPSSACSCDDAPGVSACAFCEKVRIPGSKIFKFAADDPEPAKIRSGSPR